MDQLQKDEFGVTAVVRQKGQVYIIEADNCIKIGRSKNVEKRINAIRTQSGRNIKRVYYTDPCNNYCTVETSMHVLFKTNRIIGEWFNVSFDNAVKALKSFELDLSDIKKPSQDCSDILKSFSNECMKKELNNFLDERPAFKEYLAKNGFKLYFSDDCKEIMVTDGDEVDMMLGLFIRLYITNRKGA